MPFPAPSSCHPRWPSLLLLPPRPSSLPSPGKERAGEATSPLTPLAPSSREGSEEESHKEKKGARGMAFDAERSSSCSFSPFFLINVLMPPQLKWPLISTVGQMPTTRKKGLLDMKVVIAGAEDGALNDGDSTSDWIRRWGGLAQVFELRLRPRLRERQRGSREE